MSTPSTRLIRVRRPIEMRLAPLSYFCTCWKVTPIWFPSSVCDRPREMRCTRTSRPTSTSTLSGLLGSRASAAIEASLLLSHLYVVTCSRPARRARSRLNCEPEPESDSTCWRRERARSDYAAATTNVKRDFSIRGLHDGELFSTTRKGAPDNSGAVTQGKLLPRRRYAQLPPPRETRTGTPSPPRLADLERAPLPVWVGADVHEAPAVPYDAIVVVIRIGERKADAGRKRDEHAAVVTPDPVAATAREAGASGEGAGASGEGAGPGGEVSGPSEGAGPSGNGAATVEPAGHGGARRGGSAARSHAPAAEARAGRHMAAAPAAASHGRECGIGRSPGEQQRRCTSKQ